MINCNCEHAMASACAIASLSLSIAIGSRHSMHVWRPRRHDCKVKLRTIRHCHLRPRRIPRRGRSPGRALSLCLAPHWPFPPPRHGRVERGSWHPARAPRHRCAHRVLHGYVQQLHRDPRRGRVGLKERLNPLLALHKCVVELHARRSGSERVGARRGR